jgi:hypothetical protein
MHLLDPFSVSCVVKTLDNVSETCDGWWMVDGGWWMVGGGSILEEVISYEL